MSRGAEKEIRKMIRNCEKRKVKEGDSVNLSGVEKSNDGQNDKSGGAEKESEKR